MSRRAILGVAIVMLCLIAVRHASAADETAAGTTDLEGWTSVEVEYEPADRWRFSVEEQLRLKSDVSEVDRYFTQLGVRFDAPLGLLFDGGVRFIRRNDTLGRIQGYESQRRYHLSAVYRLKPGRFSLGWRMRYQTKGDAETGGFTETERHLRLRARVRYNVRNWKLDPVVSVELYRPLGSFSEASTEFDKLRLTMGTGLGVGRFGELDVFYRVEKELGVGSPATTNIIGLKFTVSP